MSTSPVVADARDIVVRPTAQAAQAAQAAILSEARKLAAELVVNEVRKYLRLSQSPDFNGCVGPITSAEIIKLAELVDKWYRLDHGQATENVDVHHREGGPDFSKLSQSERDAWRALAVKAGAEE